MTALVEAAYTRDKADLLQEANGKVNSTRYLLRLAKYLNLMSVSVRVEQNNRQPASW